MVMAHTVVMDTATVDTVSTKDDCQLKKRETGSDIE